MTTISPGLPAERTGIEALRLTTRDVPDYDQLMRGRLALLDRHGLKLSDIQRVIAGMCGTQRFFTSGGRAFCLYVVLGSWLQRRTLVPVANSFLSTVEITPR